MRIIGLLVIAAVAMARNRGGGQTLVCGDICPTCGLGCNQGTGHGGRHTDRSHSW